MGCMECVKAGGSELSRNDESISIADDPVHCGKEVAEGEEVPCGEWHEVPSVRQSLLDEK